jgi:hypothetical protein
MMSILSLKRKEKTEKTTTDFRRKEQRDTVLFAFFDSLSWRQSVCLFAPRKRCIINK